MSDIAEYGRALFLITEEEHTTEQVLGDVLTARTLFVENPDYAKLLDTPALAKEERIRIIDNALRTLDTALTNLIKILAEKHLSYLVPKALDAYLSLYDESRGIERVEAITARPLTQEQTARLVAKLAAKTGKKIIVKNTVDPSILGGMKLRYSGTQLDGSVRTRLDGLEDVLARTVL